MLIFLLAGCKPDPKPKPKPGEVYLNYMGDSKDPFTNVSVYQDSVTAVKDGYVKYVHNKGEKWESIESDRISWFLERRELLK